MTLVVLVTGISPYFGYLGRLYRFLGVGFTPGGHSMLYVASSDCK